MHTHVLCAIPKHIVNVTNSGTIQSTFCYSETSSLKWEFMKRLTLGTLSTIHKRPSPEWVRAAIRPSTHRAYINNCSSPYHLCWSVCCARRSPRWLYWRSSLEYYCTYPIYLKIPCMFVWLISLLPWTQSTLSDLLFRQYILKYWDDLSTECFTV